LGVKRWTYKLDDARTLHVFQRPRTVAQWPWLLRLDHIDGRTLGNWFMCDRSNAIIKAKLIQAQAAKGEFK
jgi:hypothetical protein